MVPGTALGQALNQGLVSYWPMDDGLADSGALIIKDLQGKNPIELFSPDASLAWVEGAEAKFRGSLRLDGLDTYGYVPDSESLDIGTEAVSIALWVKLEDLPADLDSGFAGIFDSRGDSYVVYLDQGSNELRFKVTADGGAQRPGIAAADLEVDEWMHVVGVYDGVLGESRIYLNGELKDTNNGPTGFVNPGQLAGLGRNGDQEASFFRGGVDELAIWNRALTGEEVLAVMNDGLRDSDDDGLSDSWEMVFFGNLDQSATDNGDVDTLDNGREFAAGTDPTKADTDEDTYEDGFELRDGGDPLDSTVVPRLAEIGVDQGLVSFWRFDDALNTPGATGIQDVKGSNDLQLMSTDPPAFWLSGADAKFDGSLRVDGDGTYVPVPNSPSLDIGAEAVSIALWVKLDQLPADLAEGVAAIYDSSGDAYVLYLDKGNNELRFKVSATGAERPGIPAADLVVGEWLHVVGVYDGATGTARIFLNGVLSDTHDGPTGLVQTGQAAAIGRNGPAGTSFFAGAVDDLGIWNVALTDVQVATLFLGTSGGDTDSDRDGMLDSWELEHFGNLDRDGTGDLDVDGLGDLQEFTEGTNPTIVDTDADGVSDGDEVAVGTDPLDPLSWPRPEGTGLAAGLVAYWKLDDGLANPAATAVFDETGLNPVTLSSANPDNFWLDADNAVFGGALNVNGLDSYIVVPESKSLDIDGDAVTISACVKLESLPSELDEGYGGIYDSTGDAYVLYLDRGNAELRFKVTASGAQRPGIPESELPIDEWIHVAGVYDGSIGESHIYLNGEWMDTHDGPSGIVQAGQIAGIGRNGPEDRYLFSGDIDDLAIWKRALSETEITALANGERILPDASVFRILDITHNAGQVSLTWTSNSRDSYVVERTTDFGSYLELVDSYPGQGETTTFIDTDPPAGKAFYRVMRQ